MRTAPPYSDAVRKRRILHMAPSTSIDETNVTNLFPWENGFSTFTVYDCFYRTAVVNTTILQLNRNLTYNFSNATDRIDRRGVEKAK